MYLYFCIFMSDTWEHGFSLQWQEWLPLTSSQIGPFNAHCPHLPNILTSIAQNTFCKQNSWHWHTESVLYGHGISMERMGIKWNLEDILVGLAPKSNWLPSAAVRPECWGRQRRWNLLTGGRYYHLLSACQVHVSLLLQKSFLSIYMYFA